MNAADLAEHLRYFDSVHRVTVRAVGRLEEEDLDFRPRPEMRTPKAIVFHMYGVEWKLAEAVRTGTLPKEDAELYTPERDAGRTALAEIGSVVELVAYAESCHRQANAALDGLGEQELSRIVRSPYADYTGARFVFFINDEHWHHRGQLFTYLRLLGKEPPDLYGEEP